MPKGGLSCPSGPPFGHILLSSRRASSGPPLGQLVTSLSPQKVESLWAHNICLSLRRLWSVPKGDGKKTKWDEGPLGIYSGRCIGFLVTLRARRGSFSYPEGAHLCLLSAHLCPPEGAKAALWLSALWAYIAAPKGGHILRLSDKEVARRPFGFRPEGQRALRLYMPQSGRSPFGPPLTFMSF